MQNIEQNQKLSITMDNCPSNPPPVSNKYRWVKRRVTLTVAISTGTSSTLTVGQIATALTGVTGDYNIRKVRAWYLPDSGVFPTATFTVYTKNLIDATGTLPDAVITDHGTGTSPPKIGYKVPLARNKNYEYDTASAVDVMGVSAGTGRMVCHVTVMQCISA